MSDTRLQIGDWIKANIIGLGFYEVVSIDDFHVNVKCLKIFNGVNPHYRNHITCCHHGTDENGRKININQKSWFEKKINRIQKL